MAGKIKTIHVTYPHPNPNEGKGINELYRVEKVTDSVLYYPNQFLTRNQVDDLCASSIWKVTVTANKELQVTLDYKG